MAKTKKVKLIELGMKVQDVVTGLTGITTGKTKYLNGCIQFYIEPKLNKDGKAEGRWVDKG